jgi:hypothetical protein
MTSPSLTDQLAQIVHNVPDSKKWARMLWPTGYVPLRVIAVTDYLHDNDRNPTHPDFILTTSSPCYCTPTITIWLSMDGMEDPKADIVMLEFSGRAVKYHDKVWFSVEFNINFGPAPGERYEGYFSWEPGKWLNGLCYDARITDIKCQ